MTKSGYVFRDGWRLVSRNLWASILTVFTSVAVFFVIGAGLLLVLNMRHVVATMDDQLTIQVYLREGADAQAVLKSVAKSRGISGSKIVTKQMALDRLRSRMGAQLDTVSLLGENPLPDSVEFMINEASAVPSIVKKLEAAPGVEEVIYAGKVAEKITRLSDFVSMLSIFLLAVAVCASGIVLFNTVKLSVYAKEEEIKIMLLVGATPTYIALPYVIQGIILGTFGSVASFGLLAAAYALALEKLREMLPFFQFVGLPVLVSRLGFLLFACGMTVSLIASFLAVNKFIRKASKPL